ncbi:hypothetical protein [Methylobacterium platani]|uniref:DUF308 domain-containing protein n=1 Tax=Methylobacterium platani TaxID=427683 RepID=A0A179S6F4_9HYPH|nr:hypothetical protein [Methylobacterium platani]OAS22467.1 hypothetical protein A5481_18895 [Methylobacterium platani]
MIVALFVLALLMLIGGVAAIVQGIPFVRLEVGWTMVIAGTVGASGGAVLLGIAAAVARLGRIERALAGRPAAVSAEPGAEAAPARPGRSEPVMPPVPPPIPFPAAAPSASEMRPAEPTGFDGGAALAAGAAVAGAGLAASELRLTRAEDADLPHAAPGPMAHDPAPPEAGRHEPALHVPVEEPRLEAVEARAAEIHAAEIHASEIHAAEIHAADPHGAAPPPPAPPDAEPMVPAEVMPPASQPVPPAPEPAREEPLPEDGPGEPPAKTVIGTYDSGGNTYTMYADGTIDAETPAGRFHFASIDELKAFRSAGGEGTARSA